ncbi:hypothetical protein J7337_012225 [Fusarium musae]|uniref:GPI inositol-deacylase winged helix domain-containing protein n=1 Tax=Fusarium musae TaxID=1042133 RepID=A0A9P8D5J5_9HYPO|nr:hypothetical protein J7337_012225 [Fusarium musae]KAG9495671.1 hypothetical protein J7337_012225 [Fusarium musae]
MKLICLSRRYPKNIPEALLLFIKMELDTMIAKEEDISRFIPVQVQELSQKKQLSSKMRSMLQETFLRKSAGTFLWVSYMSQDLHKQGVLDFEASLDMLPSGLDAVYERILQSIDFEKGKLINAMLYWILVAARPLTVCELCEAVSMKPTRLLTREEVCIELIKSCGHLLQIDSSGRLSLFPETVTFLHQSAKDYLMKFDLPLGSQAADLAYTQLHEHATIVLIRYLEQINSRKGIANESIHDIANDFPLAYYAVEQWGFHFRELEDITQVMRHGMAFFEKVSEIRHKWQNLYELEESVYDSETVPLLHLSAFLGLDSLAEWCLRQDGERDIETEWEGVARTALVIACENGQENIISLLLDAGANPIADINRTSALGAAIVHCNRRVLRVMGRTEPCRTFLINSASDQDGSLIYIAADFGNEDACRFLVEDLGWDLNWQSGTVGYRALLFALSSCNFELISCFIREWNIPIRNHSEVLEEDIQDRYDKMLGPTAEVHRSSMDEAMTLLESYCTVPKH